LVPSTIRSKRISSPQQETKLKNRTTTMRRRAVTAAALALLGFGAMPALAQTFPDRPVTLVVGFSPGGSADTVARALADELTKVLGQTVVIDNKAGASGNIATQTVIGKPADGYSLLFAAINLATNPWLGGVKYDPMNDLTFVSQITSVPVVMLASNASGFKEPADAEKAARAKPGGITAASGGVGTSSHLALELYKRAKDIPVVHAPYRGGAPANVDLMAGRVELMFDLMSGSLKSLVESERVRPLAVMQAERLKSLPNVKSAAELGLPESTHIRSWQGIAVRSGTPADIVQKLNAAVVKAANSPSFKARAEGLGSDVVTSTPAAFQAYYVTELNRWQALIKAANITVE
jgi:tripartite-type tricarboxylate transporter receptor subunit TctC